MERSYVTYVVGYLDNNIALDIHAPDFYTVRHKLVPSIISYVILIPYTKSPELCSSASGLLNYN
jgi:hypothetical protein